GHGLAERTFGAPTDQQATADENHQVEYRVEQVGHTATRDDRRRRHGHRPEAVGDPAVGVRVHGAHGLTHTHGHGHGEETWHQVLPVIAAGDRHRAAEDETEQQHHDGGKGEPGDDGPGWANPVDQVPLGDGP